MAQLTVPESPKEYATHYHELLGVDYQADQTEVDRRRSPDMVNMISDFGGNPIKRDGYRRVGLGYSALLMVDGIMYGVYATSEVLSVTKLALNGYDFTETDMQSYLGNVGSVMSAFAYQRNIYILAEKCLARFDTETKAFTVVGVGDGMMSTGVVGSSAPVYEDNIPDTVISLKPDGTGGATIDDKNLFSIYQRVSYQGDGTSTQYKIPTYTKMGSWFRVEVKDANGDWQEVSASAGTAQMMTAWKIDGSGGAPVFPVVSTTITLTSAPSAPAVTGEDNVRITFAPFSTEQIDPFNSGVTHYRGYYNATLVNLLSSSAATFQSGRMFIADKYKVYYSDVSDPFSVSDLSWFDVDSEVISFTRSSNYLAILTRDNGRNTIFLAQEATRTVDSSTGQTETYFSVKASNAGIGAIAPKCVSTLSDEPMFLSSTGIFGILTNWQSEKYAVNRSSRINRRLCKEPNLETAVGIAYNDYFYLAINGRMYVLDGRHKESDRAGNKPLEAYYFEGLPAIENMYIVGDRMYFSDGENTYTWNDDLTDLERYYDDAYKITVASVKYQIGDSYNDVPTGEWLDEAPTPAAGEVLWYQATYDSGLVEETIEEKNVGDVKLTGEPVKARWCSTFDDDGAPQRLKTLMKKGSMVTIVPHYRSGCEITLVKDGDVFEYLGSFDSDLQTFEYIDFSRFSFNANAVAFDEFTKKKIKKYKRLQIQIENNKAEPFGLTQITKTYIIGNYAKR